VAGRSREMRFCVMARLQRVEKGRHRGDEMEGKLPRGAGRILPINTQNVYFDADR
jgi:hypothetical protein